MTRRAACSCGQLHLTIEGEPSRIAMCHCLECQRRTGAVISNQARFRLEQVSFAGKTTAWTRTAESGNAMTYHFCPTCGSTVFWENEGFPGTSPSPLATSPTRVSQRRPSRFGRRHATRGFSCRPTPRPSAWRSRGDRLQAVDQLRTLSAAPLSRLGPGFRVPVRQQRFGNLRVADFRGALLQAGPGGLSGCCAARALKKLGATPTSSARTCGI